MFIHNPDKISGRMLYRVLAQLKKDRTILRMNLLGKNYEGLTLITGVKNSHNSPYFLVDYPGGGDEFLQRPDGLKVFFEYSGMDRLQYSFRSVISGVEEDDIRVKFPKEIQRIQRRKNFRVVPPSGTVMVFIIDNKRYECNVINISKEGALISQDHGYHHNNLFFYAGANLFKMNIECRGEIARLQIQIRKAEIKRIDKNPTTGRYQYALQFLNINKEDNEKLMKFLYDCQREVLKRRSFLVDS